MTTLQFNKLDNRDALKELVLSFGQISSRMMFLDRGVLDNKQFPIFVAQAIDETADEGFRRVLSLAVSCRPNCIRIPIKVDIPCIPAIQGAMHCLDPGDPGTE